MSYLEEFADGSIGGSAVAGVDLGELGWDTRFLPLTPIEGHEILTRNAIGDGRITLTVGPQSVTRALTNEEQRDIIEGNTDVDIQYFRYARTAAPASVLNPAVYTAAWGLALRGAIATFTPDEQRHHALRRTVDQPQEAALREIIDDLRSQHRGILVEGQPRARLRRIGAALHLIQDSFSPAHVQREDASGWCIRRIRNYGRGSHPNEHRVPKDDRDSVTANAPEAKGTKGDLVDERSRVNAKRTANAVLCAAPDANF
jgi:hypothetical protein